MNDRYIIDILKEMKHNCLNGNSYDDPKRNDKAEALNYAIFCVERQQPTIDAVHMRHGKWEDVERNEDTMLRKCSVCSDIQMHWDSYYPNYCPNCGAKML